MSHVLHRLAVGNGVSLQGNLDPCALYSPKARQPTLVHVLFIVTLCPSLSPSFPLSLAPSLSLSFSPLLTPSLPPSHLSLAHSLPLSQEDIVTQVEQLVSEFGRDRWIANLGHGIYPDVDPGHLQVFIDTIHSLTQKT